MKPLSKNEFSCLHCNDVQEDNRGKLYDLSVAHNKKIRVVCGGCKIPFWVKIKSRSFDYFYVTLPIKQTPKTKVNFHQLS